MAEEWLETDTAADVAGSIRHAIRTAQFVDEDAHAWKWLFLALHSALQGACVCHLTTTAEPVGAVTPRNAKDWLAYFEENRENPNAKPPKTHLMALPDLLKAVRKPHSAGDRSNSAGVSISDAELNVLRRVHLEIRNQFTHFEPMSWSLNVSGVPEFARLTMRIIEDILNIGWAFRHLDTLQRDAMERDLRGLALIEVKA